MANGLKHASQGTTLTQTEFEAEDTHVFTSQATGDLLYASSSTVLTRLGIGAADTILVCDGSTPSWDATPILNTAVAKGTWTASGTWTLPAVTLGGTVALNGQAFDAGASYMQVNTTGAGQGFTVVCTNTGTVGANCSLQTISSSPVADDIVGYFICTGEDSDSNPDTYGYFGIKIETVTHGATQAGKFFINLMQAGADANVLTLSSTGVLGTITAIDAGASSILINSTAAGGGAKVVCTNDGVVGGGYISQTISASPTNGDIISYLQAIGEDSSSNPDIYGYFGIKIETVTHGATQAGKFFINLMKTGSDAEVLTLSSAGVLDLPAGGSLQVSSTQVVGARVVDARCDDAINSGDATTDGVIDSLRDAMITHGLVAAA